jgi:hypothetical protein
VELARSNVNGVGRALLQAGFATGVSDGLWAVALTRFYGRPVERLWQGVAAVPFGPRMFEAGAAGVAVGLLLHFFTAFTWSGVLLLLLQRSERLRRANPFLVGAIFGPLIWIAMSLAVIPLFIQQAPVLTWRWWVQLAGHALFVGQPMAWSLKSASSSHVEHA